MDQIKIGAFLKELRNDNNLTQEQLAEEFGVSQRSVSRWENGNTMPDISVLIELADYYEVDLREILNGERKTENMDKELKETLVMVADYTEIEKANILKKTYLGGLTSALSLIVILIIYAFNLYAKNPIFDNFLVDMIFIGIVSSVTTIVSSLRLTGKIGRNPMKRTVKHSLIVCGMLLVVAIAVVIVMFAR